MKLYSPPTARLAYHSALVSVLGSVTLVVFFAVGGFFGPFNDALSVVGALLMLALAWALYQHHDDAGLPPVGAGSGAAGHTAGTDWTVGRLDQREPRT